VISGSAVVGVGVGILEQGRIRILTKANDIPKIPIWGLCRTPPKGSACGLDMNQPVLVSGRR
jgi:hypothetical protein